MYKKKLTGEELILAVEELKEFSKTEVIFQCGYYELDDFGRYQVQMNGKGAIVKMLQRRYNISKERTASVGDSAGDIGMFQESGLAICFNPWDKKPLEYCDEVVEQKDLAIVLDKITTKFSK